MLYKKDTHALFVRLDKEEDLFQSLETIARQENYRSGFISGIGAIKEVDLGFYHLSSKQYEHRIFQEEYELLHLDGNLSFKEGQPFFHFHTVIGDKHFNCYGGHLFSAKVAITCELIWTFHSLELTRQMNEEFQLFNVDTVV